MSAAPAAAAVAEAAAEVDYARALSHVQAELQQALAANGKLEEELRRAVSAASAQAEEASSKIAFCRSNSKQSSVTTRRTWSALCDWARTRAGNGQGACQ